MFLLPKAQRTVIPGQRDRETETGGEIGRRETDSGKERKILRDRHRERGTERDIKTEKDRERKRDRQTGTERKTKRQR